MPTLLLHFIPYIAMAVMAVGGWGLWQQHKLDQVKLAQSQQQVIQDANDRAESAKQIGILQTKLEDVDAKAQPIIQRIVSAPATTGCGPSVRIAVDGVRQLYGQSPEAPGPKSALKAAMLAADAAYRRQPQR